MEHRTRSEERRKEPGKNSAEIALNAKAGIPPSNEQIYEAIETTTGFLDQKQREASLNARTRKTVADVSHMLHDIEQFIQDKNPDENLQDMFVQGTVAAESVAVSARRRANEHDGKAKDLIDSAGDVARLLVQSSDFRLALTELVDLLELIIFGGQQNTEKGKESLISFPSEETERKTPSSSIPGYTEISSEGGHTPPPTSASSVITTESYTPLIRQYTWFTDDEKREIRTKLSFTLRRFAAVQEMQKGLDEISHLIGILKEEVLDVYHNRPVSTDANVRQIINEAKLFLQRFTGVKPIERLIASSKGFLRLIVEDQVLARYLDEAVDFFNDSLNNPQGLTTDTRRIHKLDELISRGLSLYGSIQQHPYLRDIICQSREIFNAIKNDPVRNRLEADVKVLAADFVSYGPDGNPKLNFDLVNQLKGLLIPLLCEHLKYVPIPRVEGHNDTYDYWVDNINFSIGEILPDHIHFHIASDGEVNVQQLATENFVTRILITAHGIKTTMHNIKFWFRRKSFPKTEDEGWAEVAVGGKGVRVLIQLTFSSERAIPFDVHAVRLTIDDLDISISDTRHDWLYSMFVSFYKSTLLEKLEIELQLRLRSIIYKINHQLNRLFDTARESLTETASHMIIGNV